MKKYNHYYITTKHNQSTERKIWVRTTEELWRFISVVQRDIVYYLLEEDCLVGIVFVRNGTPFMLSEGDDFFLFGAFFPDKCKTEEYKYRNNTYLSFYMGSFIGDTIRKLSEEYYAGYSFDDIISLVREDVYSILSAKIKEYTVIPNSDIEEDAFLALAQWEGGC